MTNDDYIKRSDAISAIRAVPQGNWSRARYMDAVENVHAADVEPKRKTGVWIRCGEPDGDRNIRFECSVCHAGDVHAEGMNVPYCWKCGSEMQGETREEETEEMK